MNKRIEIDGRDSQFVALLESAAHLQRLVPGAVLVGGTAAILYADHRESGDHDHVVADLADRFEMVLEAVEEDEGWATNRITPGKVILGNLDGIEAGVRQMIRKTPLEVSAVAAAVRRRGDRTHRRGDPADQGVPRGPPQPDPRLSGPGCARGAHRNRAGRDGVGGNR